MYTQKGESVGHIPAFSSAPPRKNPGLAFLLSLVVPGAGQLYCGKVKRGVLTLCFFALSLVGVVFLFASVGEGAERRVDFLWGTALRACLVLYVFGFLDAYFTAREMSLGVDPHIVENPRVAAVLNLLTRGFGYWYLGERRKGLLLFILIGVASRAAMVVESEMLSNGLGIFVEIALAVLAVDAYRIARKQVDERLAALPVTPTPLEAPPGFTPAVPMGLAGLFALGYVALVSVGVALPSYDVIDQSQAVVEERGEGKSYMNAKYGVEMHLPPGWEFDQSDAATFVQAEVFEGACHVSFMAEATLPFMGAEAVGGNLVEQLLSTQSNFRLLERKPATLANLKAHEVVFSADVEGTEVVQHYFLARRRLSLYALVTTAAGPFVELCGEDMESIRKRVVISPE